MTTKPFAHKAARAVGVDPDAQTNSEPTALFHATAAALEAKSVGAYWEAEPSVGEYVRERLPTAAGAGRYLRSVFPFAGWLPRYNTTWLAADAVAGLTVGVVVIPQGMAYALLAGQAPEYGLYTSFMGAALYFLFATSKDITIGPVAVASTLVGRIVARVGEELPDRYAPEDIARAISVVAGAVLLFIGLFRLGWIVDFIPLVAIVSFTTGAALNIACGQLPKLLGVSGVNSRAATYRVLIDTLKGLPTAKLDAALGLSALFLLYLIRWFCNTMAARQPNRRKLWFFAGTLRLAFVILLYTLISWLVNRNITDSKDAKFNILGTVPSGFRVHSAPNMDTQLLSALAPDLPAMIIVLIIEHIAISKSFGRINNYTIHPSQELTAIGFSNIFGPFLGAYPATGSFSRTAIKSKSGVRTPLGGVFTAVLVVLALYALTRVFYYIPMAALSGLIVHAVGDLIAKPRVVHHFWRVAPLDALMFFAGVVIMVFTDIEAGVYFSVAASAAVLLVRIAKARGAFLGRVDVYPVDGGGGDSGGRDPTDGKGGDSVLSMGAGNAVHGRKQVYLPLDRRDGANPRVRIHSPYPGVFVYRFSESVNYLNIAHYMDDLVAHIQQHTRRTTLHAYAKPGDRPWNDPGPRRGEGEEDDARPTLRAVVLDCAAVGEVDVTAVQGLADVRTQLDLHAAPDAVAWHLAGVRSRWARRALAASGFGFPNPLTQVGIGGGAESVCSSDTEAGWRGGGAGVFGAAEVDEGGERQKEKEALATVEENADDGGDDEIAAARDRVVRCSPGSLATVTGVNRPYMHLDVASAVESVVAGLVGRPPGRA
ncbi:sulfate permease 2 [Xylariomycetidae sp. FL0641]|nr:sulfate permease 2 [Xylariomycetidae sp. FL0641]